MEFDLKQLEAFCKVVELESFTSAGHFIHLSQAAVSERIAKLEEAVGVPLLVRAGRRTTPTRLGRVMYDRSIELLRKRQTIVEELQGLIGSLRGTITVGASSNPSTFILPHLVRCFRFLFGEVVVEVISGGSRRIAEAVGRGELEAGIVGYSFDDLPLTWAPLWDDDLVLVVHPSHPWSKVSHVGIEELLREPYVSREEGSGTRQFIEHALGRAGGGTSASLSTVAVFGGSSAVKEAVLRGLGVAILSRFAVARELNAGLLASVRLPELDLRRSFYLARGARVVPSPLCETFLSYLESGDVSSLLRKDLPHGVVDISL